MKIHKNYEDYTWVVSYRGTGAKDQNEKIVQSNFVFICAGPLGSTKILMQSKTPELDISSQLGKKFNGNGGLFGIFSFNVITLHTENVLLIFPKLYIIELGSMTKKIAVYYNCFYCHYFF